VLAVPTGSIASHLDEVALVGNGRSHGGICLMRTSAQARLAPLQNRNFRLYAIGQLVSLAGTFMHTAGEAWLVIELGGNGTQLGLVLMFQFLPILALGPIGGAIADRCDRQRVYAITQAVGALLALLLGVLTATGVVTIWMCAVVAVLFGCNAAVDQPVRQGLVHDVAGGEHFPAAAALSMTVLNLGGFFGPAIAAVVIATLGVAACFFLNAVSFAAVLLALVCMRLETTSSPTADASADGGVAAGLRYVGQHRELLGPVLVLFIFGLVWQEEVLIPLLAKDGFDSNATLFGVFASAMAGGAVLGGIVTTSGRVPSRSSVTRAAWVFVFGAATVAASPVPAAAVPMLALTGGGAIVLVVQLNTMLQVNVAPEYRGRVMALYVVCMYGTRPLGAPLVGWLASSAGPRIAMALPPLVVGLIAIPTWKVLFRPVGEPAGALEALA
jgi:predicted MFS family arabinose efflux permease